MSPISVDRENKEVKIILNTKFYGCGAIRKAGQDYSENCLIQIDAGKEDKMIITIKPKNEDINLDTLGNEFVNYVMGLMQNAIF